MVSFISITVVTGTQSSNVFIPLVVCSDQAGSIHSQDAVSDPQSAVGRSRTVRDQSPDVDAWSIKRSVLQEGEVSVFAQYACLCGGN